MNKSNATTEGISFPSILGLTFVILKMCHVIDWSWWWVTAPFWGTMALVLVSVLVSIVAYALKDRKRR